MPTDVEIAVAKHQTSLLIEREPSMIAFQRPAARVSDGAGGWLEAGTAPTTLAAQRVFLSAVTRDSDYRQSSFIRDSDGEKYVNHFIIVGLPDLNIKEYDEFTHGGFTYVVGFVHPERRWETVAEADRVTDGDG